MALMMDSSALLAFLRAEPGRDEVAACFDDFARTSTVNLSEVISVLIRNTMPPPQAVDVVTRLPLEQVDFDQQLAVTAAAMIAKTRKHGLSFSDRACLASAMKFGDTVVTADRAWLALGAELGLAIMYIRPN